MNGPRQFLSLEEQIRTATRHLPKAYSEKLLSAEWAVCGLPAYMTSRSQPLPRRWRVDRESGADFFRVPDVMPLEWASVGNRSCCGSRLSKIGGEGACVSPQTARPRSRGVLGGPHDRRAEAIPKLILVIADMARSNPPMGGVVAELARDSRAAPRRSPGRYLDQQRL